MLLGSHLSIAGGLHNAIIQAHEYGFSALAMFVRNQRQWAAPPLTDEAVQEFLATRERFPIATIAAHGSYLVHLGKAGEIRDKSIVAMVDELTRCRRLGIEYLVIHPDSNPDIDQGVALIADALREVLTAAAEADGDHLATGHRHLASASQGQVGPANSAKTEGETPPGRMGETPMPRLQTRSDRPAACTRILLETTAGAGKSIGGRFETVAAVLERLGPQASVCLDTCHIFASGYDIQTAEAYRQTMADFDRIIGLENLKAIHMNDSRGGLDSRLDRHAHIGHGKIGLAGFAHFVNDPRLAAVPMILETPKEEDPSGRPWDCVNAQTLRSLVGASPQKIARMQRTIDK